MANARDRVSSNFPVLEIARQLALNADQIRNNVLNM